MILLIKGILADIEQADHKFGCKFLTYLFLSQAIESQLENTCCCPGASAGNQRQAFSDIARGLAAMFRDVDLVPSDIAAGLILLNREQSRKAQEEREGSRVR